MWLALVTHPLLDAMTVYGTQLLQPFSAYPFGVGSMFIIDPLYTLPLVIGLLAGVLRREGRGLAWVQAGLVLSTAYLAWSAAAQWHVRELAREALGARGAHVRLLATPSPFNTVLWRVVAMHPDGSYEEGFYSFSFLVARREGSGWTPVTPQNQGSRGDARRGLAWVWERMWGSDVPPPR